MERDGLIERTPHPSDRRAQIITLTPLGRKLEGEAVQAAADADAALFSGFRRFEKELMIEYMRMIVENARKL
jgi:DNA-binding MarR family transcriptional regulator